MRRPVSPAFTPKSIEALRPRVAAIVDSVLAALDPESGFDVLGDVGYPIALAVICELLDVGVDGAELFADLTPALARGIEFDATPAELAAAVTASVEMTLFLTPILDRRRRNPGDDFISALLQNPSQIAHLHADPARAIEELLRLHGPVKLLMRTATVDHDIAANSVAAGQSVLIDVQAANRDPARLSDADTMDLTREPAGHLAFGAGIHFCLGAAIARLENSEALTGMFSRFPDLFLTDDQIQWRDSKVLHALLQLPVRTGTTDRGPRSRPPAPVRQRKRRSC